MSTIVLPLIALTRCDHLIARGENDVVDHLILEAGIPKKIV